jgi:hypothetical protein
MSHVRRAVAAIAALTAALFALALPASAVDPASTTTADAAVTWIEAQQMPDGGFELAAFPGFETRDAALAIAEAAQTGTSWSTSEALAAVSAVKYHGTGDTPLDALDDFATNGVTTAGAAAKTIVLTASPLGLDAAAFDPAANGGPVDLVSLMGCDTTGAVAFNDVLYIVLGQALACGTPQADAVTAVRDAQQANGGWNFNGDPTGTDVDVDTTALAIQALVASGADATDPAVRAALAMFADNQQPTGAWQSFGTDDPNSTSLGILGIAAAGYDVEAPCWRDTVDPAKAGTPYASPTAWIRTLQLASPPSDAGRIASPNDSFGVNTFATSQSVEGLLQSWLPIARAVAPTCDTAVTPATPTIPETPVAPVAPAALTVSPRFTG